MARIVWHPAFVQAIAIELVDYQDVLTFESEHQLTAEPLKIDVLIIKKLKNVEIKKNIGRIFRMYNVVEYKSPSDYATIESYHKTQSYARLYAALNKKVSIDDMSVSVVATRHPRKLLSFVKQRYAVDHTEPGIYTVTGETCPTQIIVSEELPVSDNLLLNSLRSDVSIAQLERFADIPEFALPIDAYVYALGEANSQSMEKMYMQKKKGVILTEYLDEHFGAPYYIKGENRGIIIGKAEGFAEGEAEGKAEGKAESVVNILRARFEKVPKEIEKKIRAKTDTKLLDVWTAKAATCESIKEFAAVIK